MDRRRLTNAKSLDHTPVQKVGKSGLELRGLPEPRLLKSTFDRLRPIASRPPKIPEIQYEIGPIFDPTRTPPPAESRVSSMNVLRQIAITLKVWPIHTQLAQGRRGRRGRRGRGWGRGRHRRHRRHRRAAAPAGGGTGGGGTGEGVGTAPHGGAAHGGAERGGAGRGGAVIV